MVVVVVVVVVVVFMPIINFEHKDNIGLCIDKKLMRSSS